jgi:Arm DNA-binding domain
MAPMPLTDAKLKNAKPADKPYKLTDGGGLFILIQPTGGKLWRYKYRFAGKEKRLALGVCPDVGLADARERHAQARKTLAAGKDPGEVKKAAKRSAVLHSQTTYEAIAREWHEQRKHKWTPGYAKSALIRLEHHMFPKLGNRPIADIEPAELLSVVRIVEKSGALDMALRVMQL